MNNDPRGPGRECLSALIDGEWAGLDARAELRDACADKVLRARWARYHLMRDVIQNSAAGSFDLCERVRASLAEEPAHSNVTSMHDVAAEAARSDGLNDSRRQPEKADEPLSQVSDESLPDEQAALDDQGIGRDRQAPPRLVARGGGRLALVGGALAASFAIASFVGVGVWRAGVPETAGESSLASLEPGFGSEMVLPGSGAVGADQILARRTDLPAEAVRPVQFRAGDSYWQTPGQGRNPAVEQRLNAFLAQHLEQSPTAERQGMLPYSRLVGYDAAASR